eukprot:5223989-Prymnesium_polylepis.1
MVLCDAKCEASAARTGVTDVQPAVDAASVVPMITARVLGLLAAQPDLANVTLVHIDRHRSQLVHGPPAPGDPQRRRLVYVNNPSVMPDARGYL